MYNFDQPGLGTPGNLLSGVQGLHGIYINDAVNHTWTLNQNLLNSVTAYYQSFDFGCCPSAAKRRNLRLYCDYI